MAGAGAGAGADAVTVSDAQGQDLTVTHAQAQEQRQQKTRADEREQQQLKHKQKLQEQQKIKGKGKGMPAAALVMPMSSSMGDWEDSKKWICGRGSVASANLCRVASSIVRDHGHRRSSANAASASASADEAALQTAPTPNSASPSLSPPPGRKHLKPEKWYSAFDSEGKVVGFRKVLKRILLGGVDPSIRAEVWEFLLGCYSLSSTSEFRRQLRMARRKRYKDLLEQCKLMHSSIGTGSLAYAIGSKVMDMRIGSKDNARQEAKMSVERITQEARLKLQSSHSVWNNQRAEPSVGYDFERHSSADSTDLGNVRDNPDTSILNTFSLIPSTGPDSGGGSDSEKDEIDTSYRTSSCDFPYLPVTNLFASEPKDESPQFDSVRRGKDSTVYDMKGRSHTNVFLENALEMLESESQVSRLEVSEKRSMVLLENEPNKMEKAGVSNAFDDRPISEISEAVHHIQRQAGNKISDSSGVGNTSLTDPVVALGVNVSEDRVADWLWTLHRIVVDVVRTDRHLDFYEDTKNMARMSDILAVYAWVDPMTGYCQGMSDLLSPFIVLFEDDADAFWCFECLLRRMRPNFQMEGPVGVMKQLEALGKILQVTDHQLFKHLARIGAESLLFAFRMLLVLFRRELSFNDALCMWEMMWAADFDETMAWALEHECLEPLVLSPPDTLHGHLHVDSGESVTPSKGEYLDQADGNGSVSGENHVKSLSKNPFCGLRPGDLWHKSSRQQICTMSSLLKKNADDEFSVFCVAAILVINRSKITKEIQSMDDAIKMFNDMHFEIKVKSCIQMAIKLRKKYFRKISRRGVGMRLSTSISS